MEVYQLPRRAGKTSKLIELAAVRGGYIVCPTHRDVEWVMRRMKQMGADAAMPITATELLRRQYSARNIREFYLDDLERILAAITTVPIAANTVTKEEESNGQR